MPVNVRMKTGSGRSNMHTHPSPFCVLLLYLWKSASNQMGNNYLALIYLHCEHSSKYILSDVQERPDGNLYLLQWHMSCDLVPLNHLCLFGDWCLFCDPWLFNGPCPVTDVCSVTDVCLVTDVCPITHVPWPMSVRWLMSNRWPMSVQWLMSVRFMLCG